MKRKGFTFIELLVSISIFSIIIVSLYSAFRVGLSAYRKGEQIASLNQKIRLCLDSMALDLRNSYKFSDTESGFKAENNKVSFYCLKKKRVSAKSGSFQICRVEYSKGESQLLRGTFTSKLAFSDQAQTKAEILLDNVVNVIIEFPYKEEDKQKIVWKDYWLEKDALPLGIKINLEVSQPGNSSKLLNYTKYVYMPLGRLGKEQGR